MIGFDEITEAFTEMLELSSMTEPDEEWAQIEDIDPDALDEWAEKWAQAATLMAEVGSADHRDIGFTARTNLKTGFALGWHCAKLAAADSHEPSEPSD